MNNYYVYRHYKKNTNEVFYIGMGKEVNFRRSRSKRYRNNHWHNIVNKYDFNVEIVAENLTEQEAIELEIFLIQSYGRLDLGTGCLVNMTDGGEGVFNPSLENISKKSGVNSKMSKRVKDMDNNIIYNSLTECCHINNLNYSSMKRRLSGRNKNKTPFVYIDKENNPIGKYSEDISQPKCACKGNRNKKCISLTTKKIYECTRQASEDLNIKKGTLKSDIMSKRYNYNIMYLEDYLSMESLLL